MIARGRWPRAGFPAPCVPAGLVNFNPTAIELYVELDPHPGGWDHLHLAPAVAWCAGFCAVRTHVRTRSRARLPSRPGERGRTGRREHVLPMYAHVGVVSSVCVDGVMMYDVREGQGRRNPGLTRHFLFRNTLVSILPQPATTPTCASAHPVHIQCTFQCTFAICMYFVDIFEHEDLLT